MKLCRLAEGLYLSIGEDLLEVQEEFQSEEQKQAELTKEAEPEQVKQEVKEAPEQPEEQLKWQLIVLIYKVIIIHKADIIR